MLCVCKLQLLQKNEWEETFLAVVLSCLLVENYGALMHLLCWLFKPNSDQSPSLKKPYTAPHRRRTEKHHKERPQNFFLLKGHHQKFSLIDTKVSSTFFVAHKSI